jgi:hypothetical protein
MFLADESRWFRASPSVTVRTLVYGSVAVGAAAIQRPGAWAGVTRELIRMTNDDRLARRCITAAAPDAMSYENPGLGGSIERINAEYRRAKTIYE